MADGGGARWGAGAVAPKYNYHYEHEHACISYYTYLTY